MWYAKKSSSDQGIVADEQTGRTVAVVFDAKDAPVIAAAQEFRAALKDIQRISAPSITGASEPGMRNVWETATAALSLEGIDWKKGE